MKKPPRLLLALSGAASLFVLSAWAQGLQAVAIDLPRYLGLWYQVALYPNRFQAQCVSDTTATYRILPSGEIEVANACRMANGQMTQVLGAARGAKGAAASGQLQVRFAPAWLSWLPFVWADYWVVDLASDYRYAVVSEPKREFLWVLSRTPALSAADDEAVRQTLKTQGFDLARLQNHAQTPAK
jgi:apolipoprotein D and lipocalin family protein